MSGAEGNSVEEIERLRKANSTLRSEFEEISRQAFIDQEAVRLAKD